MGKGKKRGNKGGQAAAQSAGKAKETAATPAPVQISEPAPQEVPSTPTPTLPTRSAEPSGTSTPLDLKQAVNLNPEETTSKRSSESTSKSTSSDPETKQSKGKAVDTNSRDEIHEPFRNEKYLGSPEKGQHEHIESITPQFPESYISPSTEASSSKATQGSNPPRLPKLHTDTDIQPPEPSHAGAARKNEQGAFDEPSKQPTTSSGPGSKRGPPAPGTVGHVKEQAKGVVDNIYGHGQDSPRKSKTAREEKNEGTSFKSIWKSITGFFKQ
ncbi:hypothetical protein ABW19_dt0200208 [Dactylella cylindrospora]|nr:hypothetical protein ABW19_dt0200208 [Dactylella cylindrospora]